MAQKPYQESSWFKISILTTSFVRHLLNDSQDDVNMDIKENQTREFNGLFWLNRQSDVGFL
jgi:hypothetical protein